MDVDDGTVTRRVAVNTFIASGMAMSPGGVLYAMTGNALITIDPQAGSVSNVSTAVSGDLLGLGFGHDGVLYGVNRDGLYTVDPVTGVETFVSAPTAINVSFRGVDAYGTKDLELLTVSPPVKLLVCCLDHLTSFDVFCHSCPYVRINPYSTFRQYAYMLAELPMKTLFQTSISGQGARAA